jgi:GH24 family phage-related lysozyme (muramidase)
MKKIVLTAMLATLWMGYKDKHKPVVEPQIIEVAETSDDKLYNTAALFIKSEESLKLKPYKCQGGKWTIGWGHVIAKKERRLYRNGISVKQADELFDKDYAKFIRDVKRRFPELKSRKKVILTSMIAFNIGMRFTTDGLGRAIKRGRDIEPYLLQYKIAGGRVSRGLVRRRKAELELWNSSRNEIIAAADDYRDTVRRKIKEAYQSI